MLLALNSLSLSYLSLPLSLSLSLSLSVCLSVSQYVNHGGAELDVKSHARISRVPRAVFGVFRLETSGISTG